MYSKKSEGGKGSKMNFLEMIQQQLNKADAVLILTNEKTGEKKIIEGRNIVTDAGDVWYAQKACGQTPTNDFTSIYHATAGPATPAKDDDYSDFTVIAGSEKAVDGTYPMSPDTDAENTGDGNDIVSWRFQHATSDGPFTDVTHSFISIASATGTDPILNSYKWAASWTKDTSTSAKIFTNHTMNGV